MEPGSFTKNFSWGPQENGLRELHKIIRDGFENKIEDVPRAIFRDRVALSGRPDYLPLNFFLFNTIKAGVDFVVADELVFQAVNFRHSANFDKLALFAFNLSQVGTWKRAEVWQSRPALWAYHYIADRVGPVFDWNTKLITAKDIEGFVQSDARYRAETARKLSTNLNYLYQQGRLVDYKSNKSDRWWLSASFLALDRVTEIMVRNGKIPQDRDHNEYLTNSGFDLIAGRRSLEKNLAAHHFVELYTVCGGRFVSRMMRFENDRRSSYPRYSNLPTTLNPLGHSIRPTR